MGFIEGLAEWRKFIHSEGNAMKKTLLAILLLAADLMILNRKNPLFKNVKLFK